jgi:hypothetical protein
VPNECESRPVCGFVRALLLERGLMARRRDGLFTRYRIAGATLEALCRLATRGGAREPDVGPRLETWPGPARGGGAPDDVALGRARLA